MSDYYQRKAATHVDGTLVFSSEEDIRNEREIAGVVESAWRCELRRFGALSPLDWYAVRDERVVGLVELKSRTHATDTYPTVFLNLRKWTALMLASVGFGVPPIFVVKFTDGVRYVDVRTVGGNLKLSGCKKRVKSVNDIEPVVEVAVSAMKNLAA